MLNAYQNGFSFLKFAFAQRLSKHFIGSFWGFSEMEKMRHQWGISFDDMDMDHNGLLEKADIDEIEARAARFIPAADLGEIAQQQDEFWKDMLQTDDINTVCTLSNFLSMMENMYTSDKPRLIEFWRRISTKSMSIFIDFNGDGQITKAEMYNAAYEFDDSALAAEKLLPISVAESVAMSVKFNTIPGQDAQEKVLESIIEG